ncbi:MAG: sugar transferase [Candidatus Macondimonas sp.]
MAQYLRVKLSSPSDPYCRSKQSPVMPPVTWRMISMSILNDAKVVSALSEIKQPFINYMKFSQRGSFLKRLMDVTGAVSFLIVFAPLIALIALLVRLSGPDIIFAHTRVGRNGRLFPCYKFRTMVPDAQAVLARLLVEQPALRAEWERDFKLKDDPRITRIGHFLRKYSLDELPQFWNVVRGDMSLVGPRPVVPDELHRYGTRAPVYLAVRPGVTGLWQVGGRNDVDYAERIDMDSTYVAKQCLLLDLSILFKTVAVVFQRRGAY